MEPEVGADEAVEAEVAAEVGGEQEHAGCLHQEAGSESLRERLVACELFVASRPATLALRSGGSWCGELVAVVGAVEEGGKTAVAAVYDSTAGAADGVAAAAAVGFVRRACLQQLRG